MFSGPRAALLAAVAPLVLAQPALRGRLPASQDAAHGQAARSLSGHLSSCAVAEVEVFTGRYGSQVSWEITSADGQTRFCAGGENYFVDGGYDDHQRYLAQCCLPYGSFEQRCQDSFTDGWNGGSIRIDGESYCGPTVWFADITVSFELLPPTATVTTTTVTETPATSTLHSSTVTTTDTATQTSSATMPLCVDFRPDGEEKWFDSDGSQYDCEWYGADIPDHPRCLEEGFFWENFNMTAVQACCACGGGVRGPPTPAPAPTPAANCSVSEIVVQTRAYGREVHWEIVPLDSTGAGVLAVCSGPQPPGLYVSDEQYTVPCCLPRGSYMLKCIDSYGDGWNGGSLQIAGEEYCGQSSFSDGYRHNEALLL